MDNRKYNNFDLVRLLAALQVCIGHTINQLEITSLLEFEYYLDLFPGVPVFFIISGYLIAGSYENKTSVFQFYLNRAKRLYPALIASLALSVIIVLCFNVHFTTNEFIIWILSQLLLLNAYDPSFLSSFGAGKLNPPLWTILVEVQFYLLTPLVGMLICKSRYKIFYLIVFVNIIFKILNNILHSEFSIYGKVLNLSFLPHFYMFVIGFFLYANRKELNRFLVDKFHYWLAIYLVSSVVHYYLGFEFRSNWQTPIQSIILGVASISFSLSYLNYTYKFNPKWDFVIRYLYLSLYSDKYIARNWHIWWCDWFAHYTYYMFFFSQYCLGCLLKSQ